MPPVQPAPAVRLREGRYQDRLQHSASPQIAPLKLRSCAPGSKDCRTLVVRRFSDKPGSDSTPGATICGWPWCLRASAARPVANLGAKGHQNQRGPPGPPAAARATRPPALTQAERFLTSFEEPEPADQIAGRKPKASAGGASMPSARRTATTL